MSTLIDRILSEACLDERISDGIFDMSNNIHMEVLREGLSDYGLPLNDVRMIHNKMLEGKYPERQAYNRDGLLVTFPTPQHKQRAIQRGTHFEKDPSAGQQNVFGGGQQPVPAGQPPVSAPAGQPSSAPSTPSAPASPAPSAPKPNVFGGGQPPKSPAKAPSQEPSQLPASSAPAAPTGGQSSPSSLPPSSQPAASSDQQSLDVEPAAAPTTPGTPPPPAPPPNFDTPKSPQQKAAEAEAVKRIMGGDDTNPTLLPSLTERHKQLREVYDFAKRMGYKEAMLTISEAMNS